MFFNRKNADELTAKKNKMSLFMKLDLWRNIIFILFYVAFLSYNIVAEKGNILINRILIGITLCYLLFFVIISSFNMKDKHNREIKKTGTKAYKIMKKIMLLISALIMAGTIISVNGETDFVKLFGTIFTIINLTTQIFLTIIIDIITKKVKKNFENVKNNVMENINETKENIALIKNKISALKGKKDTSDNLAIAEDNKEIDKL